MRDIPWKTYLTTSGVITTGTGTVLAAVTGTPTAVIVGGAIAACAACAKLGVDTLRRSPRLDHLDKKVREQAVRLFPLAPAAHAAWVAGAMIIDAPPQWAAALVGLGAAEYAVARGLEYKDKITPKPQPAAIPAPSPSTTAPGEVARATSDLVPNESTKPVWAMQQVLTTAGLGHISVKKWEWVGPSGEILGIKYTVKLPANLGKKGGGEAPSLTMNNAESIAIAFGEVIKNPDGSDCEIGSSWVQIQKLPLAGTYTITITNSDTMSRLYPYEIDARSTSVREPALIGYGIDGFPVRESVAQHWLYTGGTRFGKTGLVQTVRAHILRCRDAVLWCGGTVKLYDSLGPWVDPFLGTGILPPIDWIADGAQDLLDMVTAAFKLGRWRQKVPHTLRRNFKNIILEIDEASFFLMLEKTGIEYEGEWWTPSAMVENIIKGVGSAGIYIHLVSQRGTNDQFGASGGSITANIHVRVAFRTSDGEDIGRAFGNYKLPKPRNKGEYYMQGTSIVEDEEGDIRRLRAPYIQETDPTKPHLHDGANLNDVARAIAPIAAANGGLDAESTAALVNEKYAMRPRTAEQLFTYLTGMDPAVAYPTAPVGVAPVGGDGADGLGRPVVSSATPPAGDGGAGTGGPVPGSAPVPNLGSRPADGDPVPVGVPAAATTSPVPEGSAVPEPRPAPVPEPGSRGTEFPTPVPAQVGAQFLDPVPAVPGSGPSGFPVPVASGSGATVQRSSQEVAQERASILIKQLMEAGDTDGINRLARVGSLDELDEFEAELNGTPIPGRVTVAERPAPPAWQPTTYQPPTPAPAPAMPPAPAASQVVQLEDRLSRADRILRIILDAGPEGISRGEIIAALIEGGDEATAPSFEQQVDNALRGHKKRGTVVSAGRGYVATVHMQQQDQQSSSTTADNYTG